MRGCQAGWNSSSTKGIFERDSDRNLGLTRLGIVGGIKKKMCWSAREVVFHPARTTSRFGFESKLVFKIVFSSFKSFSFVSSLYFSFY